MISTYGSTLRTALLSAVAVLALLLGMAGSRPAHATPTHATGSLALETPIGGTPYWRPQDASPQVIGKISVPNVFGNVGVFAAGQLQTRSGFPYTKENKAAIGLELPFSHVWTVYSYAERRFNSLGDRVYTTFHDPLPPNGSTTFRFGIRYNFDFKF